MLEEAGFIHLSSAILLGEWLPDVCDNDFESDHLEPLGLAAGLKLGSVCDHPFSEVLDVHVSIQPSLNSLHTHLSQYPRKGKPIAI